MKTTHSISRVDELNALRSPVRQSVLEFLTSKGSATVNEMAHGVGLAAESLYYHIHKLERVGLIHEKETRRAGKRDEVVYVPVAEAIRVDRDNRSPEFLEALFRVYSTALRATERGLRRALNQEKGRAEGPRTGTQLRRQTVRLKGEAAERLRSMIDEMDAFIRENDDPAGEEALTLTSVLYVEAGEREGDTEK